MSSVRNAFFVLTLLMTTQAFSKSERVIHFCRGKVTETSEQRCFESTQKILKAHGCTLTSKLTCEVNGFEGELFVQCYADSSNCYTNDMGRISN